MGLWLAYSLLKYCLHFDSSFVTVSLCLNLIANHVFEGLVSNCLQAALMCVGLWFGFQWLTLCFQSGSSVPVLGFRLLAVCFQLGHRFLVLGFSLAATVCGLVCCLLSVCLQFASSLVTASLCLDPVWYKFSVGLVTLC